MLLSIYRDSDGEWWLNVDRLHVPDKWKNCPARVHSLSDLPDDLQAKLTAVCQMEVGQVLEGVGKRIGEQAYYVFD